MEVVRERGGGLREGGGRARENGEEEEEAKGRDGWVDGREKEKEEEGWRLVERVRLRKRREWSGGEFGRRGTEERERNGSCKKTRWGGEGWRGPEMYNRNSRI